MSDDQAASTPESSLAPSAPRPRPKPVIFGHAVLPWGAACQPIIGRYAGYYVPAGWVLPGGERVTDLAEARMAAVKLHALMCAAGAR